MKKIALIGSAPSSVRIAPYGNPEWEIWGCSPGAWPVAGQYAHKWFELHRWEPGQPWLTKEYCEFLQDFPGEVVTSASIPAIKNHRVLETEKLVERYGPYFFNSSLSWMIAMAIEEGATTIGLWGVDMAATGEYGYQRAGCQYFAMVARSLGIEFGVPPESDLLRPAPLYGVCEQSHNWIKCTARDRELRERLNNAERKIADSQAEVHFLRGALDDLNWSQQTWFGHTDTMGRGYVEPPLVPIIAPVINVTKEELDHVKPAKRARRKGQQAISGRTEKPRHPDE